MNTITPIYVAKLAHSNGCAGLENDGYALFPAPRTRTELENIWQQARTARDRANSAWEQEHPIAKAPEFNEHWAGTRSEYKTALTEHRILRETWQREKTQHADSAEHAVWQAAGGELCDLRAGWLPSCGGEYDDHAHQDAGVALYILRHSSCRCACGDSWYHYDADESDSGNFGTLTTPLMWQVTVNDDHPAAVLCGTNRFITATGTLEPALAAFDTILAARNTAIEQGEQRRRQLEARAAITVDELEAMTYPEWVEWHERTGLNPRIHYAGERQAVARHELDRWEADTQAAITHAACSAGAKAGCWPIGMALPRRGLR